MNTENITVDALLRSAYGLLGDGMGGEWNDNPEYTRAIVELASDLLGVSSDGRAEVVARIRFAAPPDARKEANA